MPRTPRGGRLSPPPATVDSLPHEKVVHRGCASASHVGEQIARSLRAGKVKGLTCMRCMTYRPVAEFTWPDGTPLPASESEVAH